ncbi:MAG: TIM barrel protein [Flavitalea sp.]
MMKRINRLSMPRLGGIIALSSLCLMTVIPADAQRKQTLKGPLYGKSNLVAWCVIPFDSKKRNSAERSSMLKEMGLNNFVYDWRAPDLPNMETELATLKKNGIRLKGVWFYDDARNGAYTDSLDEFILNTLKKTHTSTALWVTFPKPFFEGLIDDEKVEKAVKAIRYIHKRAAESGSTIALYNHGDWFGEPENEIRIIKASGLSNVGMVYNFHHAHERMDHFDELLKIMLPYLTTVNLNGMRAEGPQILSFGEGDREAGLLKILKESGFKGDIGIIGHTEGEDVQLALQRNLDGLKKVLLEIGDTEAAATYH